MSTGCRKPSNPGFTLIELLIVVAIIGILAAIAVPNFMNARMRATIARIQGDHGSLATAIESYSVDNGAPPCPELASADGQATTWPYYLPDLLMAPISYIGEAKIVDPLGRPAEGLPTLVSRYRFKAFRCQTRSNLPGGNSPGASAARSVLGEWMLVSHGPNRWLDLPTGFADGGKETDWFWLPYNSSNGILSSGDVIRAQGAPQVTGYPGKYNIKWVDPGYHAPNSG